MAMHKYKLSFLGKASLGMTLAVLVVTGLTLLFSGLGIALGNSAVPDVLISSAVWSGARQLNALELRLLPAPLLPLESGRLKIPDKFAYLWLHLENKTDSVISGVLTNRSRNYYTGFLALGSAGALTVYEHGDTVPSSRFAFRYYRAAFPLVLEPGETRTIVLEYHGPRGLVLDPALLSTPDFFAMAMRERTLMALAAGCFVFVVTLLIAKAIVLRLPVMFSAALFVASVFLFFLRQSRALLLLMDPLVYPEWLFPLTVALNLLTALIFAWLLLGRHAKPWQRWAFPISGVIIIVCVAVSFFLRPYEMADMLNVLAFPILGLIILLATQALRNRDFEVILIALAFVPWITMMVLDILGGLIAARLIAVQEYQQLIGLAAAMVLLAVALEVIQSSRHQLRLASEKMQSTMVPQLVNDEAMIVSLHALEAGVRILVREFHDPKHIALTKVIIREASYLLDKAQIRQADLEQPTDMIEVEDETLPVTEYGTALVEADNPDELVAPTIGLFCRDYQTIQRLSLILKADRLAVREFVDIQRCLQEIADGSIQVLVVDMGSTADEAFRLCSLVRANHNLLELPILMLLKGMERSRIAAGYAAGVNDFLGYPANPALMVARIQTLVRLRQVYGRNVDLAKIEQEKNAFLYFMTHNINTPLTLLVNRIAELEAHCGEDEHDLLDDLKVSTQEISEIVQNVLTSFRLSDGKATVRLGPVDLDEVVQSVIKDLSRKAVAKKLTLTIGCTADGQQVLGDSFSIRNILYNLVDNALKFSDSGSEVSISINADPVGDGSLMLDVRDYGPGISEADRTRLFGRFQKLSAKPTAGESSTGLGLYVAREMAMLNGGSLRYIHVEGGACFRLIFQGWRSPLGS